MTVPSTLAADFASWRRKEMVHAHELGGEAAHDHEHV